MSNIQNALKSYLLAIGHYPLLSAEEEKDLAQKAHEGDEEAREQLINCNLRLVVSVAKNYKCARLSLADLIQEGNLGLIKAVDKYDETRGYRFSTCAVQWIRSAITKAITDKGKNIRIPAHIYQLMYSARQAEEELGRDGHKPTTAEIARHLKVDESKIKELDRWKFDTISIDTPLDNGTGKETTTIGDLQPDTAETPDQRADREILEERLQRMLAELKPRVEMIMRLRFGKGAPNFSGKHLTPKEQTMYNNIDKKLYAEEHTLEEIGAIVGLTRERVRQICKNTLEEMRLKW